MKKTFLGLAASIFLSGCFPQKDFIRPSDAIVDKVSLAGSGSIGNIGGYLSCQDDFCTIHETIIRFGVTKGVPDGSSIVVNIDVLSREDKKFLVTKCVMGRVCEIVVTGKYSFLGNSLIVEATEIEKVGLTKLIHGF